jgi:benzil reductase ((S)-benzoin forming)
MGKKVAIITGGSAGIGMALVKYYAEKGFNVFSVARSEKQALNVHGIVQIQFDLSDISGIEGMFNGILSQMDVQNIASITLINNAGTLGNISRIENLSPEIIQHAINVNFTAPMILSGLFIKAFQGRKISKKIINISSGAAVNPYYGWSTYCTTKSAIDMMVKTIALEQQTLENGVSIFSVYPGVVETAMQSLIRKSSTEDFKEVQRFIDMKENNLLAKPEDVAPKIFSIEQMENLTNGEIIDIRNL